MTTFRFVCVSFLQYIWDLPSRPSKRSSQHTILSEIVQNLIEKYHTVGNSSKSNGKIEGRDKGDTLSTQIHDCLLEP